jgi:hypothetical protein
MILEMLTQHREDWLKGSTATIGPNEPEMWNDARRDVW